MLPPILILAMSATHAIAESEERAVFKGHTGPVWSVTFSPDGKTLASGSADGTAVLWDVSAVK
jgi:WD40 repeat protein